MPPDAADVLDCSIGGVLPSVCAVIGGLVVAETVKLITGIGEPLIGRMLSYDARSARVREVEFRASPDAPPVASLTDHTGRGSGPQRREPSADTDDVATVTAQALLAELGGANPPVLVDVRTPEEREQRPLTEAADTLEVPMTELEAGSERLREHAAALAGRLAEGADVVIVCSAGVRSARAVLALATAGVTGVRSLQGGTLALDAASASARRGRSSSSSGMVRA
jgi:adenylyltransferase/sulfurtransferase